MTAAALAANHRLAADITVDTGFALVLAAPDGETGPRLCQEFLEVEVCTIVFEQGNTAQALPCRTGQCTLAKSR